MHLEYALQGVITTAKMSDKSVASTHVKLTFLFGQTISVPHFCERRSQQAIKAILNLTHCESVETCVPVCLGKIGKRGGGKGGRGRGGACQETER